MSSLVIFLGSSKWHAKKIQQEDEAKVNYDTSMHAHRDSWLKPKSFSAVNYCNLGWKHNLLLLSRVPDESNNNSFSCYFKATEKEEKWYILTRGDKRWIVATKRKRYNWGKLILWWCSLLLRTWPQVNCVQREHHSPCRCDTFNRDFPWRNKHSRKIVIEAFNMLFAQFTFTFNQVCVLLLCTQGRNKVSTHNFWCVLCYFFTYSPEFIFVLKKETFQCRLLCIVQFCLSERYICSGRLFTFFPKRILA